jgi:hypothetical protein
MLSEAPMKSFLCVLLFAAACFAQSTEQTLIDLQKAAAAAQTKKDADFFRRTLADDYLSIGSGGDSGRKADLVEGISDSDITDIQLYNFKFVPVDENSAILAYDPSSSSQRGRAPLPARQLGLGEAGRRMETKIPASHTE